MALTDFRDAYVGTASHEGMVTVPAKKGKSFILDAEIHTTLPEIMQVGAGVYVWVMDANGSDGWPYPALHRNQHGPHPTTSPRAQIAADCEANGMTTEIKAAGSLRAQIVPNVITVGGCFGMGIGVWLDRRTATQRNAFPSNSRYRPNHTHTPGPHPDGPLQDQHRVQRPGPRREAHRRARRPHPPARTPPGARRRRPRAHRGGGPCRRGDRPAGPWRARCRRRGYGAYPPCCCWGRGAGAACGRWGAPRGGSASCSPGAGAAARWE